MSGDRCGIGGLAKDLLAPTALHADLDREFPDLIFLAALWASHSCMAKHLRESPWVFLPLEPPWHALPQWIHLCCFVQRIDGLVEWHLEKFFPRPDPASV